MPVCDCQFYRLGPGRLETCLAVEAAAEAVAGVGLHSFHIAVVVVVPMLVSLFLRFQSQYPISKIHSDSCCLRNQVLYVPGCIHIVVVEE